MVTHQKMRSFNCMLTLIAVVVKAVNLNDIRIMPTKVFAQSDVLWYGKSTLLERIVPEYFVVFSVLDQGRDDSSDQLTHRVVHKLFFTLRNEHLPALFAIPVAEQEQSHAIPSTGFLYCWYCTKKLVVTEFRCDGSAHHQCPQAMIATYLSMLGQCKRNIPWNYFENGIKALSKPLADFCPVTLKQKPACLGGELELVASFLTDGSNRSAVSDAVLENNFASAFPTISYNRLSSNAHPTSVIAVGRAVRFRFITSDGIRSTQASFATFAAPFSNSMWFAL